MVSKLKFTISFIPEAGPHLVMFPELKTEEAFYRIKAHLSIPRLFGQEVKITIGKAEWSFENDGNPRLLRFFSSILRAASEEVEEPTFEEELAELYDASPDMVE